MSLEEVIRKQNKNGSYYFVLKEPKKKIAWATILGALIALMAAASTFYGMLSFNRPDLIALALENKGATLAICIGAGVGLIGFSISMSSLGRATFEKAINSGQRTVQEESGSYKEDLFSYGACTADTNFELFVSNVLKSLSAYATSSEVTAAKLLDKGVAFMAGGLVFYIVAVVIWQVFANLTKPDPHVMYIGMAACSMTFIVVEFLAAWFFKQYRYYVEVSLSCLRVRSVYDRYLLNYYALREFKGEADKDVRSQLVEVLKEDVNWPTYKGGVVNDFNYMVESMGAAHTSMEKMKDIFQPKKKAKSKAEKA